MMDSLFRSTNPKNGGCPLTIEEEPTTRMMDFSSIYNGSDRETSPADSRSMNTTDPPGEDAASVVEVQRRNLRGLVVDGTINKDLSSPRYSTSVFACCWSVPRCLTEWNKRERILLALVLLNSIVILGLLGNNISLSQKNRASEQSALASIETRSVNGESSWDCPGGAIASEKPSSSFDTDSSTAEVQVGDPDSLCGCAACTQQVWDTMAGGTATCGDRIQFLMGNSPRLYPTQVHACRRIAFEHPCECGGCDPSRCHLPTPEFILPSSYVPPQGTTPAPTPIPAILDPTIDQADMELYCFPEPSQRTTYKLWGGMVVQVKEDVNNVCGPGGNRFSRDTVIVDELNETITLQYKNGIASEVRVLLPEEERPFTYGTYSFSVKSVVVKDSTDAIVSDVLPKDLVLGLFTWDGMENYAVRENYLHEVDIEISRWGCETNSDLQFLVQPPGQPQLHRLFSGKDPESTEGKYSQGGHIHSFTWNPARIDWITSAGGTENNRFTLKTEEAVYRNVPDYVQCLPDVGGNMEVRLNLWNNAGAVQPTGTSSIEVVIDRFSFTPSGLTHAAVGAICSKHCQCSGQCIDHKCTA